MLCAVARDRTGGFVVTKAPSPLRKNSMTLSSDCVDCSNATVLICASVESVARSSGTGDGTGVRTSAEERVEGGGGDSVPVYVPVSSSDSKVLCSGMDTPPPHFGLWDLKNVVCCGQVGYCWLGLVDFRSHRCCVDSVLSGGVDNEARHIRLVETISKQ